MSFHPLHSLKIQIFSYIRDSYIFVGLHALQSFLFSRFGVWLRIFISSVFPSDVGDASQRPHIENHCLTYNTIIIPNSFNSNSLFCRIFSQYLLSLTVLKMSFYRWLISIIFQSPHIIFGCYAFKSLLYICQTNQSPFPP